MGGENFGWDRATRRKEKLNESECEQVLAVREFYGRADDGGDRAVGWGVEASGANVLLDGLLLEVDGGDARGTF